MLKYIIIILFISITLICYCVDENKIYINNQVDFMFEYSSSLILKETQSEKYLSEIEIKSNTVIIYYKLIDKIPNDIGLSFGLDQNSSKNEYKDLKKGILGETGDFNLNLNLHKFYNKDIYYKTYDVFSRYDLADVRFERVMIFYYNNFKIIIHYIGDRNILVYSLLEHFLINKLDYKSMDNFINKITNSEKNSIFSVYQKNKDKYYFQIQNKDSFGKYIDCISVFNKYNFQPEFDEITWINIEDFSSKIKGKQMNNTFNNWYIMFDKIISSSKVN